MKHKAHELGIFFSAKAGFGIDDSNKVHLCCSFNDNFTTLQRHVVIDLNTVRFVSHQHFLFLDLVDPTRKFKRVLDSKCL